METLDFSEIEEADDIDGGRKMLVNGFTGLTGGLSLAVEDFEEIDGGRKILV